MFSYLMVIIITFVFNVVFVMLYVCFIKCVTFVCT